MLGRGSRVASFSGQRPRRPLRTDSTSAGHSKQSAVPMDARAITEPETTVAARPTRKRYRLRRRFWFCLEAKGDLPGEYPSEG